MGLILGGPNTRFMRSHGEFAVGFSYVNGERAMCLWPKYRKGVSAFIVCDSSAWKYNPDLPRRDWYDSNGDLQGGPEYLMQQAMHVCGQLWGMPEKASVVKLATVIAEGLGDLVRLPPEPPKPADPNARPLGTIVVIEDGKTIAEHEVPAVTAEEMANFERRIALPPGVAVH